MKRSRPGNRRTIDRIEAKKQVGKQNTETSVGQPKQKRPRPATQTLVLSSKTKRPAGEHRNKHLLGGLQSEVNVQSRPEATRLANDIAKVRAHAHESRLNSTVLTQVLGDFAFFEPATATASEVDATHPGSKCDTIHCKEQPCRTSPIHIQSHRCEVIRMYVLFIL